MAITRKSVRKAISDLKKEKLAIATKDGAITDEDRARIDDIDSKVADHEERLSLLEDAADTDADSAKDWDEEGDDVAAAKRFRPTVPATAVKNTADMSAGLPFARFLMGKAMVREMGVERAANLLERGFGDGTAAKALVSNTQSGGGALVPQTFIPSMIELLRAATVFREAGPLVLQSDTGNATMPRLAGGAAAGYGPELSQIGLTQETFDDVQFTARKLTAAVPVSNDLIRRAVIGVDAIVRDDLVAAVARRSDLAFQLGSGSSQTDPITGLVTIATANNLTVTAPAVTANDTTGASLQAALNFLYTLRLQLQLGASRMIRPTWFANPVLRAFLSTITDKNGFPVFASDLERGVLLGFPYKETIQLPYNLNFGTSTAGNGQYLILMDMADAAIMDTLNATVDVDTSTTFTVSGTQYSAFLNDMTVMRVITEHDMQLRHFQSLAVGELQGWVPSGLTTFGGGQPFTTQALNTSMSSAGSIG